MLDQQYSFPSWLGQIQFKVFLLVKVPSTFFLFLCTRMFYFCHFFFELESIYSFRLYFSYYDFASAFIMIFYLPTGRKSQNYKLAISTIIPKNGASFINSLPIIHLSFNYNIKTVSWYTDGVHGIYIFYEYLDNKNKIINNHNHT